MKKSKPRYRHARHIRRYFSDLKPDQREEFAEKCGTSVGYLIQLAGGHRSPSPKLALALEKHSGRALTAVKLRPDIFSKAA